ncbi:hypothetical protein P8C59_005654 [Phyllachora maydis]|uniref:L-lactate dehydrogenase (cytochrome) n=1 Tax=Phyllachora maydis TaxID=1825666 RepID=A0AAD9I4W1_9PEZI|nr:hypothetical protein P8C59_005654 [Phyllachora maydis]
MAKVFQAEEVAKHTSTDDCWVILYGAVYDVTGFLPQHPGGSKAILRLAGRDATEDYDPIHPAGTLEDHLPRSARLGTVVVVVVDPAPKDDQVEPGWKDGPPPLESVLNLDEMEAVAKRQISGKCWAYYFSAADDLWSKHQNGAVYRSILLRPRVLVDCSQASTATSLLGHPVGTPLYVAPAAMARLAHPDGEAGIAKGISRFGAMQLVSNNASMRPEQIVAGAGAGAVFGWQLYVQTDRRRSEAMIARINRLRGHFKCIVLTLDAPVPGKREHDERRNLGGGVGQQLFSGTAADLTWHSTLPWLAGQTDLPIVLKGVQTHEDAYLAAQWARQHPGTVRAIILSNHGGRALDTAPPAVHTLLEIRKYCPDVLDTIEVWVDGGIRRGTDVVKALCLGASAVGLGRAALWGLGAAGWRGVERTFEILQAEIQTCMSLLGAKTVADLGPRLINARAVERDIFDGHPGLDRGGVAKL